MSDWHSIHVSGLNIKEINSYLSALLRSVEKGRSHEADVFPDDHDYFSENCHQKRNRGNRIDA